MANKLTLTEYKKRREAYEASIIFEENILDMLAPFESIDDEAPEIRIEESEKMSPDTDNVEWVDTSVCEPMRNDAEENFNLRNLVQSPNDESLFEQDIEGWFLRKIDISNIQTASYASMLEKHRAWKANTSFEGYTLVRDPSECFQKIDIPPEFLPPEMSNRIPTVGPSKSATTQFTVGTTSHGVKYDVTIEHPTPSTSATDPPRKRRRQGKGAKARAQLKRRWRRGHYDEPGVSEGDFGML